MVFDGASPLKKIYKDPNKSIASEFVKFVKNQISKSNNENIESLLNEISYKAYNEFKLPNDKLLFPSCGIAYAQIFGNKIEISTIGDCEAFISFKNGKTERVIIDDLPRLDNEAIKIYIDNLNDINKAKELLSNKLIENRLKMNEEGGYDIYTISNNPSFKFNRLSFDINEIKELYLYTDGITQAFDELKLYDTPDEAFNNNIKDLVEEIFNICKNDKECINYPRFKQYDDTTIIKITF